jgi:hypothetical protein
MPSASNRLAALEVGERLYRETTIDRYAHDMRTGSVPRTRRPPALQGREFRATALTAVGAGRVGDVRLLICWERTA